MKTNKEKLLIISNETIVCNKINAVLKQLFEVKKSSFEEDIISILTNHQPQLILYIGKNSPIDTHRKLSNLMAIENIPPIVLASDIIDPPFIITSFRFGVVDFIELPLDVSNLITALNKQFKQLNDKRKQLVPKSNIIFNGLEKLEKTFKNHAFASTIDQSLHFYSPSPYCPSLQIPTNVAFINVQFFGKFCMRFQNQTIERLFGRRATSLLSFLLLNHKKPICRDKLLQIFWPYSAMQSAKNNLNVTIHNIRKTFQDIFPDMSILDLENDCYTFAPNLIIQTDISQFEESYRKAKAIANTVNISHAIEEYQCAIQRYHGDFLEEIYEPWAEKKRDHFREIYLFSLNQLSCIFFEQQQYMEAIKYGKLMLERDGCMEEVHRRLMMCYSKLGMKGRVIRQFKKCKKVLQEELGMTPSTKTTLLLQELMKN